ncbi:MAG: dihydroorotate dehydrogenase electron transfer subunit, partial [Oscillospiraceae bacterium]|nr:dihydroorotate dehydrogenase electron transfer subunit [Oscillospiraceae bacterium]
LLKKRLEESECDLVCACGPTPMLRAIATLAEGKGIKCQVSMEERMGCGIGACLVCVCKIKNGEDDIRHAQVCKYGPVIDSKEVIW